MQQEHSKDAKLDFKLGNTLKKYLSNNINCYYYSVLNQYC